MPPFERSGAQAEAEQPQIPPGDQAAAPVLAGAPSRLTAAYLAAYGQLKAAVLRRVGDREAAEDIVQDAYLRLAGRTDQGIGTPEAFIFRVAGNLALDQQRRDQRRGTPLAFDGLPGLAAADPGAERRLMDRQTLTAVLAAVSTLPPRCREVFVLRKLEGLEQAAIARRLGISRNMVEKHLRRALETLAEAAGPRP